MDKRIGQLRCGECEAVFNNQFSLSRHEKIHLVALRCARDGCEKTFSSAKHLAKHLKRHSDTNITIRIVPFNIQTKIEAMEELSDGASRQQSVQQLKNIKKEKEDAELRVKIEVKDEHDQTGEKEIDRSNGQAVRGCVKKFVKKEEKEDDDDYCGCKECIREKVTSDYDNRVLSGTSLPLPPAPSADGHFGTRHSQIALDGDTPSNSTSLHELIGGEKLDTSLWLRGVIDGLEDTMIDSLLFRLIMSSSTASIAPQRSSTVLKLCQLIEGQKEKTNKLLRIDMDRIINSLFLRLANKALVNFDWAGSRYVGYRSQVVNLSDQVESPNAQSLQQPSRITQPSTSMFEQRSFTSSFNPHQTHVSELMFQLIAAERVDLKLWLRGEMEQLSELMVNSLFFSLIMSSSTASVAPQRCSTVSELCQLVEGEKKKMNSSLRKEIDRLVHSLLERLKNKLLVRTAGSENVDHRSQVNLLNNVESANHKSHQPSSSIPQPSSSTSIIDEFEPKVKNEIEEGNLEVLQYVPHYTSNANQQSEQLIELDGQDQSYQDGHIALSHKINSNSSFTNNTNDEGLENQTIQDDQQPNGQVNNAIDNQQNWDKLEIEEKGDDEQIMDIEEEEKDDEVEDEETENDSDNCEEYENNRDDKSSRFVVSNPSSVMIQSARLPKRKQCFKKQLSKCNVQLCKRVKKEENGEDETWDGDECDCDECRVERMIKQENDQTGEEEFDLNNGPEVRGCVKDKNGEGEDEDRVNNELKRLNNKKQRIDKMTEEDPVPIETSTLLPTAQSSNDTELENGRVGQIDETDYKNKKSCDGELMTNEKIDDIEVDLNNGEDDVDDDTEMDEEYDENYEESDDELSENEQMDDGEVDEEAEDTEIDEESEQNERVSNGKLVQLSAKNFVKRIEPDELGKRFECNYEGCGIRSKQKHHLIEHIRRHTGEMPFKCSWDNCCRAFIRKDKFNDHLNAHTGNCPFVCTWSGCNARFKQSSSLRRHNSIHLNDLGHRCDWPDCVQTFTDPSSLKRHRLRHTGKLPHKCDWPDCVQTFTDPSSLKRHRLRHTGELPHKCDWPDCVKAFTDSSNLKRHRLRHTGERPHKCDWPDCVQAFSSLSNMKEHRRLHTKERPFTCNQCDVAFKQKKNFNAHYRRKHSDKLPFVCH